MKKTVKKNIAEMKNLVKYMPKTINESIQFETEDDELDGYEDEEMLITKGLGNGITKIETIIRLFKRQ